MLRFIMLGGFLGAGKTTALARLARHYTAQGKRVGLVTNDQAQDLVDTNSLRAQGFAVQEVPGACFCCKFDDLVGEVGKLEESQRPEVILAEPVGSCTDLVATVIQPLKSLYRDRFVVAPYAVLFKPSHGLKILSGQESGFSPKAAYIFRKQLEEADAVVLNRTDELSPADLARLTALIEEQYPGRLLLPVSAKTGAGFDAFTAFLERDGDFGKHILDIDYDTYAEGEAEMGWLNVSAHVTRFEPFALDDLLRHTVAHLSSQLVERAAEIAHLKVIGLDEAGTYGVANAVSNHTAPELSLPSNATVRSADVIVNARVAIDPAELERLVCDWLAAWGKMAGATVTIRQSQSLRPGRPTPTHRYAQPA